MKHKHLFFVVLSVLVLTVACKEKEQPKDTAEYAESFEVPRPEAPIGMSHSSKTVLAQWKGEPCSVLVSGEPSDTLPMVMNEYGQKYKDNIFKVKILKDSVVVFQRNLTKRMFLPSVKDANMRAIYQQNALLKAVTAEVDEHGNFLYFNVTLQAPEAVDDDNILFKYYTDGKIEQVDIDYMYSLEGQDSYED